MLVILNENAKMEDVKVVNGKIDTGALKKVSRRAKNNNAKLPVKLVAKMYRPTLAIELNKDTYLTQAQINSNDLYVKKVSDFRYLGSDGIIYGMYKTKTTTNRGQDNNFGYLMSTIEGKCTTLNNHVYSYFVGDIEKGFEIHHLDGNRKNNNVSNLQKLSRGDNLRQRFVDNKNLGKEMFSKISKNYIYDKKSKTLFKNKNTAAKYVNGLVAGVTACLDGRFKTYKGMELIQLSDEEQKQAENYFIFNKNQKMVNISQITL